MSDHVRYRVVGERAINGVAPGGTVTLDPERVNIPALVSAGLVELVEDKPKTGKTRKMAKSEGGSEDVSLQLDGRDGSRS